MQVHMILADMTTQYRDISGLTRLPDQLPGMHGYLSRENMVSVLGNPDKVILHVIDSMWPLPVFFAHGSPPMGPSYHTATPVVLKLFA
jgi:hypothetical protein